VTFSLPSFGSAQSSSIASISEAGNLVTLTLSAAPSNAKVGTPIEVSGVVSPLAYNGCFLIASVAGATIQYVNPTAGLAAAAGGLATVPSYCPYLPDFVATTQSNAVFVANYGAETGLNCDLSSTDSVATLNPSTNVISKISYLPAGSHPVALAETPNAQNLYVVNQGSNTVTDISPTDMSTLAVIPVGNSPAWAVSRVDGQRLYVVTQGDGQLYTIDTASNAQVPGSPQSVGGAGANFVLYDKSRNRIYVVNPNAAAVYAFSAVTDPPTPLGSTTGAISIVAPSIPAGTPPCVSATCSYDPVTPVSVAALPDGSRFYVSSYVTAAIGSPCPDPSVPALRCVIPQVTVFDAGSLAVKTTVFPLLPAVANPVQGVQPFAVAPAAFCAPLVPYATTSARFRMSAAAAADSSRVYSSLCDGGSVAIINTKTSSISTGGNNTTDTLVLDLPAPFSAAGAGTAQNPIWLLTGQ
jgi:DNA-binding beta-propeller fold protein YncE